MADVRLPAHLYANQRSASRDESVPSLKVSGTIVTQLLLRLPMYILS